MRIRRIDHVQLAMPAGQEDVATGFYEGLLGIPQVQKPPHLAARGGCWFEHDRLKVHLGVENDFRPARKAHPALLVDGLGDLVSSLRHAGVRVVDDEPLEGYDRVYVDDPFGNRIELLEPSLDLHFRLMETADLSTLAAWFAEPEVARWWGDDNTTETITAKYQPRIDGTGDATEMWIAEIDGAPAAMLQCYRHAAYPDTDAAVGIADAVGIDYLVGAGHRGRGLGGRMLREFAHLALERFPDCTTCVAAPARANEASWRSLERAGFTRRGPCDPPDEPPCWAYTLDRPSPTGGERPVPSMG